MPLRMIVTIGIFLLLPSGDLYAALSAKWVATDTEMTQLLMRQKPQLAPRESQLNRDFWQSNPSPTQRLAVLANIKQSLTLLKARSAHERTVLARMRRDIAELEVRWQRPSHLAVIEQSRNSIESIYFLAGGALSLTRVEEYEQWLAVNQLLPDMIAQLKAQLVSGIKQQELIPRAIILQHMQRIEQLNTAQYENSRLYRPITQMPRHFLANQKQYLILQYSKTIQQQIGPALTDYLAFLRDNYLPLTTNEESFERMVSADYFFNKLQNSTLAKLNRDELLTHVLDQTAQHRQAFTQLATKLTETDDAVLFYQRLLNNQVAPITQFDSQQREVIRWQKSLNRELTQVITDFPQSSLELVFQANANQPGIAYRPGSERPLKAAQLMINWVHPVTSNAALLLPRVAAEGMPGVHLQSSLAREHELGLDYRHYLPRAAIAFGWRYYAVTLVDELQAFDDLQRAGLLAERLNLSAGLITDIALHGKGWSPETTARLLRQNFPFTEADIDQLIARAQIFPAEMAQRFIAAVALAELRRQAQDELQEKFSLSEFHQIVLTSGNVDMATIETRVRQWVASIDPAEPQ